MGKAFQQEFMVLHVTLNRECFAQKLAKQGQFVGDSKEGLAFANSDFGGGSRSIAANAKPLRYLHYKIFLFPYLVVLRVARMKTLSIPICQTKRER